MVLTKERQEDIERGMKTLGRWPLYIMIVTSNTDRSCRYCAIKAQTRFTSHMYIQACMYKCFMTNGQDHNLGVR